MQHVLALAALPAASVLGACGGPDATSIVEADCARDPVTVLVVLQGSESMLGGSKWPAARAAVDGIFDAALLHPDARLNVGLTVFGDREDTTVGEGRAGPYDRFDVPPAPVDRAQHDLLRARVDGTAPWNGAPLFEALAGQVPLLGARPGRRVLVLVTDGVPDPRMPAGDGEQVLTMQLVVQAHDRDGIVTRVVGVGPLGATASSSDYDPRFVGQLAVAGGAAQPSCSPAEAQNPRRMCQTQLTPGSDRLPLDAQLGSAIEWASSQSAPCAGQ